MDADAKGCRGFWQTGDRCFFRLGADMTNRMNASPLLVSDIGGTNARFGLIGTEGVLASAVLRCADYSSPAAAAAAFLEGAGRIGVSPRRGAFAVAAAVIEGESTEVAVTVAELPEAGAV